jgi:hypothetical protein
MKTGKSLTELAQEIERQANAKRDFIANTGKIAMVGDHLELGKDLIPVSSLAHNQIAEHCDIPVKYYNRMRDEAPGLLANNVNQWFGKYPAARMVRTMDNKVRAFLSDKYRPLENYDLAQAVLPVLMENELEIMSSEITERRMYIKAVDRKVARELAKQGAKFGDGGHTIVRCLSPAITISNSEVGGGAVSILAGTYDSFCSNLATFGERSMRRHHVGAKHELTAGEDVYALLSDDAKRKTDAAIWAQVRDVVKAAFDQAKFDSLVKKIEGTKADKIEDPVRIVELSSKRFGFNEGEGKSILKHLIEGADLSRFGLHNAITRASQDFADYDRATEFERAGGQVIELAKADWAELAKAA